MSSQNAALPATAPGLKGFKLTGIKEFGVPVAVLAIILALITPMPAVLLDLLIVLDIAMSVIVLMVTMYIVKPSDFNVFPTALLLLTMFRLALNVSSARLILLNGNSGTAAAGTVIEAFGNFVVGGNYVIGCVIFLILIAIQYVVINHGAVRISEVSARFTLDALPGKQMSIDAEMNAGLIDEGEARKRRKQLAAEAEFYGSMDGASRFTQRDAIASILITAINIGAGFLIGVLQHGMELRHALETYTVLTIGDGLVTVIPALMISVSGGLIVTRASSDIRVSEEFQKQLFGKAEPLLLASGVLVVLGLFPGLPTIPFLLLGGGIGAAAWRMRTRQRILAQQPAAIPISASGKEDLETLLKVESVAIEVGLGLASLVAGGKTSPLLKRIAGIRRQFVTNLGFLLPPVRVSDNLSLRSREYSILLKGSEIARFELLAGNELGIPTAQARKDFAGQRTQEPAFGLPAIWVPSDRVDAARGAGYTLIDSVNVIGTHLSEVVKKYAAELFSRQDAKLFCDRISHENPKLVEDLVPKLLPLATIQKVLQNLLRERVSIKDGISILEAISEAAVTTRNSVLLTEFTRQAIRRSICRSYLSQQGEILAWLLDPSLEQVIESSIQHTELNSIAVLTPQVVKQILAQIGRKIEKREVPTVVVTSSAARHFVRQIVEVDLPNVFPLSHNEIPSGVSVRSLGVIA